MRKYLFGLMVLPLLLMSAGFGAYAVESQYSTESSLALYNDEGETLNKTQWDKMKSDVEFIKSAPKKRKEPSSTDGNGSGDEKNLAYDDQPSGTMLNLGPIAQIFIISLFVVLLLFLLFALVKNTNLTIRSQQIPTEATDELVSLEENFTNANLEKWLRYAIEQNDYYLIIRIHFLMALKTLERLKLICWKKDKTNWHYIQELGNHHFQTPFTQLVYEYDELWYGEKDYSDEELKEKLRHFESFKTLITTNNG